MLILLIYCPWWAASSGDIVDDCDYTAESTPQSRCGDLCIAGDVCICGEEKLNTYSRPQHCCVDFSPNNITQCYIDSRGWGICPQGRVLDKTETCNGHCYNDYHASEKIGRNSQFHCGYKCVPVYKMCRGYSGCQDGSDVTACNENLTCVRGMGDDTEVRHLESGLSDEHFYCPYGETKNNGLYDIITRNDEDDLDIRKQKVKIDFSSLTECKWHWGGYELPGRRCSGFCLGNPFWCRGDRSLSCAGSGGTFATNNQALCANATFWQNKTCEVFYEDGDKATLGRRCSGGAQQCIIPWYLSCNYFYEVALEDLLINLVTNNK